MKKFTYTLTNQKKDWGKKYDKAYSGDNYDTRVWEVEQHILLEILGNRNRTNYMDFASGTGRVSSFLSECGFKNITCIDSSNEMLKQAKKKMPSAKFITLDITDKSSDKKLKRNFYETVTAFRFFLNAEQELRKISITKIADSMKKDAIFVFNIHGNKNSLRFFPVIIINILKFFLQAKRRKNEEDVPYRNQMSVRRVKKMLSETNLNIETVYSYSFIPKIISKIIPRSYWINIEKKLITKRILVGTHLLFVCKKKK
jgi:SAM-dependent methyltransferase